MIDSNDLVQLTPAGLYCPEGDFYVDPWQPVARAVTTHVHSDHVCWGCERYLVASEGKFLARLRLGADAVLDTVPYGERLAMGGVTVSLHPAGHILGSSQIRIERQGQVIVISGDYKLQADPTCRAFESVRCHTFVTETTFGLPIYRWAEPEMIASDINSWWRSNQAAGKASILYGYAVGKAQRILASVDRSLGPIYTHGAVEKANAAYRADGVDLPETRVAAGMPPRHHWSQSLIVAPPSAHGTPWLRRFGDFSAAMASGWMQVRGVRRRKALDRGFALSDHVDWPSLLHAVRETGAESVWTTHGYAGVVARWLEEHGIKARVLPTRFRGETAEERETQPSEPEEAVTDESPSETSTSGEAP